ncbi:choline/carnitine O-acyltransferase [Nesterenkonia marinintestina]|uniref:choline/carnitine O-acyltransferase n=1 Tax=Nesterenkonia marinintestina TaxID=2979865 RepID=UPI0021C05D1A|nr:choline/carnitine O-acyltransferase [Nesterenkonia sp. GX14115]
MSLPPLPVPPLDESLSRLLRTYSALAAPEELAEAEQTVADFRRGVGQALQQELEEFADHEYAAGRSWLTREWDRQYMAVRDPLTLSSNAVFALALTAQDTGDPAARTAETIHRIAAVHLTEARGETETEVDPRGNALTMEMWRCLAGGTRHPQHDVDTVETGDQEAANREIGILRDGRLFTLTISDDYGRPHGTTELAESLAPIMGSETEPSEPGFAAPSVLGGARLAPLLDDMLTDDHNAATYRRLQNLLFTVTLHSGPEDDAAEQLRTFLTEPGRIWVHKPLSYQFDPQGGDVHVSAEHSVVDGGTLIEAVRRMQEITPADHGPLQTAPTPPQELTWRLTDDQRRAIDEGLEDYMASAAELRVDVLDLPRVRDEYLPFRMSTDGLQQLIMTIAQLITYGRVRSVYESVDMRQFRAGRTECLRPVTPEAVAFARALIADPHPEDTAALSAALVAALDAHRDWVKACKKGHGFDRHLAGLEMIARRHGTWHPLFDSPAVADVRTDLLSTTSLGTADQIVRYTFAPTVPQGFGIAYTQHPDRFEFTVSHLADQADRPDRFLSALEEAAQTLHDLIRRLPPV